MDSQVLTSQILSNEDIADTLRPPSEEQSLPTEEEDDDDESPPVVSAKKPKKLCSHYEDSIAAARYRPLLQYS